MDLKIVSVLLFDDFETLDAMGPVEVFGCLSGCQLRFISRYGGEVTSSQRVVVKTERAVISPSEAILIPGGQGTRPLSQDADYLSWLQTQANAAALCMTVCTGSALLACTPLLDGIHATSNKRAFTWITSLNNRVHWQPAGSGMANFTPHPALVRVSTWRCRWWLITVAVSRRRILSDGWSMSGMTMRITIRLR